MRRSWRTILIGASLLLPAAGLAAADDPALDWAFLAKVPHTETDSNPHTLPGSPLSLTWAQVRYRSQVPDWYPSAHPAAPAIVLRSHFPDQYACGYCHLATGQGRPENAAIAGLPRAYILEQVAAFRDGSRTGAKADYAPSQIMRGIAETVSEADLAAAAAYYAAIPRRSSVRVVEADTAPRAINAGYIYAAAPEGGTEPIGHRIVEMPDDIERFELRDPTVRYTAWVPNGAIAQGARLAARWGPSGGYACSACHGAHYEGIGAVPPLSGRSPTGIVRQLAAFRSGARHGGSAELMRQVAADMSADDMIALAAYLAAQPITETR